MIRAPLERLFEGELLGLASAKELRAWLERHGLPERPQWIDEQGKSWTLAERLPWLILRQGATEPAARLFAEVVLEGFVLGKPIAPQLREHPLPPFHAIDQVQKQVRARAWLAFEALSMQPYSVLHSNTVHAWLSHGFRRSFRGLPEGTPASGWGSFEDGGWLAWGFQAYDQARAATPRAHDWAGLARAWLGASLLGVRNEGRWAGIDSFWGYGGVHGTRKGQVGAGLPGWEAIGQLPAQDEASLSHLFGQRHTRPGQLTAARWEALMQALLARAVSAPGAGVVPDVRSRWSAIAVLALEQNRTWCTPSLLEGLQALTASAWEPIPGHYPHQAWDGLAVQLLQTLKAVAPERVDPAWEATLRTRWEAMLNDTRPHAKALAQYLCQEEMPELEPAAPVARGPRPG